MQLSLNVAFYLGFDRLHIMRGFHVYDGKTWLVFDTFTDKYQIHSKYGRKPFIWLYWPYQPRKFPWRRWVARASAGYGDKCFLPSIIFITELI
jgi:hypothetical protein